MKNNGADISYTVNIKYAFENTLERKQSGKDNGRETINCLKMAIAYLDSVNAETLTEQQIKHVIRLAHYRGTETDYRALQTA